MLTEMQSIYQYCAHALYQAEEMHRENFNREIKQLVQVINGFLFFLAME